jgi:Protein of unknown function (DUF732)
MVARGLRWAEILCMAGLAVVASGGDPVASAAPTPNCLQTQGPGCGRNAFLADMNAAGFTPTNGQSVELAQGIDLCDLMNEGFGRGQITGDFARLHPEIGPDRAAQVVDIAIRDLCPWNH